MFSNNNNPYAKFILFLLLFHLESVKYKVSLLDFIRVMYYFVQYLKTHRTIMDIDLSISLEEI